MGLYFLGNSRLIGSGRCKHRLLKSVGIFSGVLVALFLVLWVALALAVRYGPPIDVDSLYGYNTSSSLFDRHGRLLRSYLATDERWRIPVAENDVSPWVVQATLAVEDKRFRSHGGVDYLAFLRAFRTNLMRGRIVSGASTLTMQAVMLDQEKSGRTLKWKLRQIWRALRLERQLSKDEILSLYLSNAPYGGNIQGIEAAAYRYFGVSAKDLDLPESALLAGLPQSPSRLRPDRNLSGSLVRRNHVLDLMYRDGLINESALRSAKASVPVITQSPLPREAPHFTDMVHSRYPRVTRMSTTLDLDIQHLAESKLHDAVRGLLPRGVTNGSVVVIENSTGNVLALVGSVDYDNKNYGQVNGALAIRSPGSALKPLIYGYAFDAGVLLPQTVLSDVPMSWAGYVPENFHRNYQGLVRADKALAWSLNIPAVEVLQKIGIVPIVGFLRSVGLTSINGKTDQYGLSLVIGSCGVRLLDLTNAYAMFSRGGEWRPWRICSEDPVPEAGFVPRSWSFDDSGKYLPLAGLKHSGSSWFVLRALSDMSLRQPDEFAPNLSGLKNVAWKTGTSSDYRDAWTIATEKNYTVGVWLGNYDSKPSRALVGASVAAPVALEIVQALQLRSSHHGGDWPFKPTSGLRSVSLCAESGLPVNRGLCSSLDTGDAIVDDDGKTLLLPRSCSLHRKILVDAATGFEVCDKCMASKATEWKCVSFWPVQVQSFLKAQGVDTRPQHSPDCVSFQRAEHPRIISPVPDGQYIEDYSRAGSMQKILLKANYPLGATEVWWFANDVLIAHGSPDDEQWWIPKAGNYLIRVTDDKGRADTVRVTVNRPE
ncbi:MAG: penicillin-binding protein 1C [Candidatus Sumerlaeales bacterium]|nr:penicillin-binding protein 1C [Candidatus Sumerlaeales bacterium]